MEIVVGWEWGSRQEGMAQEQQLKACTLTHKDKAEQANWKGVVFLNPKAYP